MTLSDRERLGWKADRTLLPLGLQCGRWSGIITSNVWGLSYEACDTFCEVPKRACMPSSGATEDSESRRGVRAGEAGAISVLVDVEESLGLFPKRAMLA